MHPFFQNFIECGRLESRFRQFKIPKVAQTLDFIKICATFSALKNVVRKGYFDIFFIFLFNSFGR